MQRRGIAREKMAYNPVLELGQICTALTAVNESGFGGIEVPLASVILSIASSTSDCGRNVRLM